MSVALRGGGDINTVRADCSGSRAVLLREHSQVRVRDRVRVRVITIINYYNYGRPG